MDAQTEYEQTELLKLFEKAKREHQGEDQSDIIAAFEADTLPPGHIRNTNGLVSAQCKSAEQCRKSNEPNDNRLSRSRRIAFRQRIWHGLEMASRKHHTNGAISCK